MTFEDYFFIVLGDNDQDGPNLCSQVKTYFHQCAVKFICAPLKGNLINAANEIHSVLLSSVREYVVLIRDSAVNNDGNLCAMLQEYKAGRPSHQNDPIMRRNFGPSKNEWCHQIDILVAVAVARRADMLESMSRQFRQGATGGRSKMGGVYASLDEKKKCFQSSYYKVDSEEELFSLLHMYSLKKYAFRGQSNAFWKIRSSALRWWQDQRCPGSFKCSDYLKFLDSALQFSQKSKYPQLHLQCSVPTCCKNKRRAFFGDYERWGFLQHYGFPTPLIDFTYDFKVALFMALSSNKRFLPYFSIYVLNPHFEWNNEIYGLENLIEAGCPSREEFKYLSSFYKGGWGTPESGWYSCSCVLIHKTGKYWHPCVASKRLASQDGLFVYMRAEKTLEEQMSAYRDWVKDDNLNGTASDEVFGLNTEPLICIDVSYSLADSIRDALQAEGYTKEFLGLADKGRDNVAKQCFDDFVRAHTK